MIILTPGNYPTPDNYSELRVSLKISQRAMLRCSRKISFYISNICYVEIFSRVPRIEGGRQSLPGSSAVSLANRGFQEGHEWPIGTEQRPLRISSLMPPRSRRILLVMRTAPRCRRSLPSRATAIGGTALCARVFSNIARCWPCGPPRTQPKVSGIVFCNQIGARNNT
jgi:hypothetical protein